MKVWREGVISGGYGEGGLCVWMWKGLLAGVWWIVCVWEEKCYWWLWEGCVCLRVCYCEVVCVCVGLNEYVWSLRVCGCM